MSSAAVLEVAGLQAVHGPAALVLDCQDLQRRVDSLLAGEGVLEVGWVETEALRFACLASHTHGARDRAGQHAGATHIDLAFRLTLEAPHHHG